MYSKAIVDCRFSSQICLPFLPGYIATQLDTTFPNILYSFSFSIFCWINIAATVETLDTPDDPLAGYLHHFIKQRLPIHTDCFMKVK